MAAKIWNKFFLKIEKRAINFGMPSVIVDPASGGAHARRALRRLSPPRLWAAEGGETKKAWWVSATP
jgi:hypothetical protein